jgi:hypothetical protein
VRAACFGLEAERQPIEAWEYRQRRLALHPPSPSSPAGAHRRRLLRTKWNEIAEVARAKLNTRLKKSGRKPGKALVWQGQDEPLELLDILTWERIRRQLSACHKSVRRGF